MSKVTLWSREGVMLDRKVRSNAPLEIDGLRRLDVPGIGDWLIEALASHADQPVEFIVPVSHGAGVAGLIDDALAFMPLDYEQPIPQEVMAAYRDGRDDFSLTGSPALPDGLNLGAQIYMLERRYPRVMQRATLLPWAQYWAWFLSGSMVSEVTSLGCHSDLWSPGEARYSPMAMRLGWDKRFAPVAAAGDIIGTLRPELAMQTGLPSRTKILAGLHDSNAALLAARGFPEIANAEATVLSTGTWFIAMRLPTEAVELSGLAKGRDCLINVDVHGRAVPSARFMGGREIETLIEFDTRRIDIQPDQPALLAAVPQALREGAMVLPTLAPGCGPFPHEPGRWINRPADRHVRRATTSLYAALVTDSMLDLIGSNQRLLVEGRFAEAEVFVCALASLRPAMQIYTANAHNDVSFGAIRLIDPSLAPQGALIAIEPLADDLDAYRSRWLARIGQQSHGFHDATSSYDRSA